MVYNVNARETHEENEHTYWFIFKGYELLVYADPHTGAYNVPTSKDIECLRPMICDIQYFGQIDEKDSYIASLSESVSLKGFILKGLRYLYHEIEDDWYLLANRACHLNNWKKMNRYCGCCGEVMNRSSDEVAMLCGNCGNIVYPRISPAVIVAITKGERILLAHGARFSGKMYSVLAGYVEAGETLEDCVQREVMEEVGIRIKNIKYFSSQPWPYPDSLMVAFTAEHESGEISVDGKEIEDANWYCKDDLPELPSRASVAMKLIEAWMNRK